MASWGQATHTVAAGPAVDPVRPSLVAGLSSDQTIAKNTTVKIAWDTVLQGDESAILDTSNNEVVIVSPGLYYARVYADMTTTILGCTRAFIQMQVNGSIATRVEINHSDYCDQQALFMRRLVAGDVIKTYISHNDSTDGTLRDDLSSLEVVMLRENW